MSKAVNDNQVKSKELKALYIIGPGIDPAPEILELYNREDCLVVGNGIDNADLYEIYKELNRHNLRVGPNTRIDISAHSKRVGKEHHISLDEDTIKTKDFFKQLQGLSPVAPLYIHLWSCYGGTANKDIEVLNPGSTIVTHGKSQYEALNSGDNFAHLHSMTRYLNEENLTPHLQYLYDQLENYQATTFNQKESDGNIVKFKTICTPAQDSITDIISNILERKQYKELLKEFQNYLDREVEKFSKSFGQYLPPEDIEKFQYYINNISDRDMKNYITGVLINVASRSAKNT